MNRVPAYAFEAKRYAIALRSCYGESGTDVAGAPTRRRMKVLKNVLFLSHIITISLVTGVYLPTRALCDAQYSCASYLPALHRSVYTDSAALLGEHHVPSLRGADVAYQASSPPA
eukprot:1609111-Rhodomonas_salina.4